MKTIAIVGSNRGIGLEFVQQLSSDKNNKVFALCRKGSETLSTLPVTTVEGCDVTDQSSLDRCANQMTESLDWLIHVSGILSHESLENLDFPSIERQIQVNTLGPLKTIKALLPKVKDGGTIALLTSRMGSLADNTSGGYYGYRMSKAALNMAGVSLAQDLKSREITVLLLHPGFVKTEMTNFNGQIDTETSVKGMIALLEQKGLEDSGTFWHTDGTKLPW